MKTKNLIAKLILIVMVVLSVLAIYSNRKVRAANTYTDSNGNTWYYTVLQGQAYGYGDNTYVAANVVVDVGTNYSRTSLTIPDTLGGYPVVSIGSWDNTTTGLSQTGTAGFIRATTPQCKDWDYSSIPSYLINNSSFWRSYYPQITSITLPETIVQINDYAFYGTGSGLYKTHTRQYRSGSTYWYYVTYYTYGLPNLQRINFPKRLRSIGNYAFYNTKISSASFDSKTALSSIGNYAFYGTKISSLDLPRNVASIGNYAFYNNSNLTRVSLAEDSQLTTIGNYAFCNNYNLTSFEVNDNCKITTIGNYAFSKDVNNTTVLKLNTFDFSKLTQLTTIGNNAFDKTSITSVDLSNSNRLTTIGANAFSNNTNLVGTVNIGENVTTIGNEAFYKTNITGVTFAESENKVTVGARAFANTKITDITLTNRISSIGEGVLRDCIELTNVTIDNDCAITSIPNYAFYNAPITNITIPSSVTTIGSYAFAGTGLVNVTIPSNIKTIGTYAFANTASLENLTIEAGDQLTTIPTYCFQNSGIKTISIPSNVTTISNYAFMGSKLESFEIPASITNMGTYVFQNCTELKTVTFENTTKLTKIPDYTFYNSGLENITIPSEITQIGNYAFSGTKFTTFEIPASITSLGNYVLSNTENLESVTFEENSALTVIPSYAFYNSNISSIEIGESITEIQSYAFKESNIENLVIKGNVTTLGTYLFQSCTNLKRVEFTSTSNLETLPDYIFKDSSLEEVVLPVGLKTIGISSFENTNITEINLPNTLVTIGNNAFRGTKLEEVQLPSSVKTIGSYAFAKTEDLETFTFAETSELTLISEGMFAESGIETITIPNYITTIGSKAFSCISPTSVNQTDINGSSMASIYEGNGSKLKSINIPASVTSIGTHAFSFTQDLETVTFDENTTITTIPSYCFEYSGISEFELPATITSIDSYAFEGSNIEEIFIPNTITSIGTYAYRNTENAKSLVFEENTSLRIIPSYCFYNSGIETVEFTEGITTLEQFSFVNCKNLQGSITLPDSITALGSSSPSTSSEYPIFAGCDSLSGDFVIGEGVRIIPAGFMGTNCTNIGRIILGSNVTQVQSNYSGYGSYYIGNEYHYGYHVRVNGAFPELTVIYTKGDPNNVNFMRYWNNKKYDSDTRVVEYTVLPYKEYVSLSISTLPGVKVIDADTNEELESTSIKTGIILKYKAVVDEEHSSSYDNLKIYRSTMDGNGGKEVIDYTTEVQSMYIVEDALIGILNTDSRPDLALRMYLTKVNETDIYDREPVQTMSSGNFAYLHTKNPYSINKGDYIKYKIRVYNEGSVDAHADKINIFIPEGLEFLPDNKTNMDYKWEDEGDSKYSSTYLTDTYEITENEDGTTTRRLIEDKTISNVYAENGVKYRDIEIVLRAVEDKGTEDKFYNVISEIASINGSNSDADSNPGSITGGVDGTYRHEEAITSNSSSYIEGDQDDDDFEAVKLKRLVKADYDIVIGKIDGLSKELLKGAKFNLLDSNFNIIDQGTTNSEGLIDFGRHTTYGTKDDVYYIEEVQTPDSYVNEQKAKVKLMVHKKAIDEENGTCSVSMDYELTEYEISTDKTTYIPITTENELKKIGSNEDIEVNGKIYKFTNTANYQLLNDIELSGTNWTPISYYNGILEGNGHKIKNLYFTTDKDYIDVNVIGLFGRFEGIIDNVILDNVQIDVNLINTVTEVGTHTGIGAFAGEMISGTIQNCTVNGTISASTDNIGGFVGHTREGHITRFLNNTNNCAITASNVNKTEEERDATDEELAEVSADEPTKTINVIDFVSGTSIRTNVDFLTGKAQTTYVATASNIGGIIGCSLGSLEMKNCTNNAIIKTPKYNGAGLVGYLDATNFRDIMNIYPSQEDNVIKLVLENTKVTGKYDLRLSSKDIQTLGLITGGVYKIIDKDKNVIPGYDSLEITDESMKIAEVDITDFGVDTYYIEEVSPAAGYRQMEGKVKVEISRYWDREAEKFKVKVKCLMLSDSEYEADIAGEADDAVGSSTGIEYEVDYSHSEGVVGFDSVDNTPLLKKKGLIENSKNNAKIIGTDDPLNIAGIVANAQSKTILINCENNGDIYSDNKDNSSHLQVAGIVAEIDNWKNGESKIIGCKNTAEITASQVYNNGAAAGIISHAFTDITIDRCSNEGHVSAISDMYPKSAGILAFGNGIFKISNTTNKGLVEITAEGKADAVGGILGCIEHYGYSDYAINSPSSKYYGNIQYDIADSNVYFDNCINQGVIKGDKLVGGLAGYIIGNNFEMKNCKVYSENPDNKLLIEYYGGGDVAGMIAYANMYSNIIKDCEVYNTNVSRKVGENPNELIGTKTTNVGGLIGEIGNDNRRSSSILPSGYYVDVVKISNCRLKNSNISAMKNEVMGGIAAFVKDSNVLDLTNNTVIDSHLANSGRHNAGILGDTYISNATVIAINVIENCIKDTEIYSIGDTAAGIFSHGYGRSRDNINILRNKAENINIQVSSGHAAGIATATYEYNDLNVIGNEAYNVNIRESRESGESGGYSSNPIHCGIIDSSYWCYGNAVLNNNKVKDFHSYITSSGISECGCIASIFGSDTDSITMTDNYVDTASYYLTGSGNQSTISGILGMVYTGSNNKPQVYRNNRIRNFNVYESRSTDTHVAGVLGYAGTATTPITIENCSVENFNANIVGRFAGLISGSYLWNNIGKEKTVIKDCSVKDIDVTIRGGNTYAGGVVGELPQCIIQNIEAENIKIRNIANHTNVGGIAAWINTGSVFENISLKNLEIDCSQASGSGQMSGIGGLQGAGYANSSTVIDTYKNCHLENIIIKAGSNATQVGGFLGEGFVSIDVSDCSIKNAEIYSVSNVTSSSYNCVSGMFGSGHYGNVNLNSIEMKDVTLHTKAAKTAGIVAGYVNEKGYVNDLDIENLQIIDERSDSDKSSYLGGNENVMVGIGPYGKWKSFRNINMKNININAAAKVMGLFTGYVSNDNNEAVVYDNINIEDIDIHNYGTPDNYNTYDSGNSQQTCLMSTAVNSPAIYNNVNIKDAEVTVGKGNISAVACWSGYDQTFNNCKFEDLDFHVVGKYVSGSGEYTYNDGANCIGVLAATKSGQATNFIDSSVNNVEFKIDNGIGAGIGALLGKVGGANLNMTNSTVDDVTIVNKGNKGSGPYLAAAGGLVADSLSTSSINDSEISNIDIVMGEKDMFTAYVGGIASASYSPLSIKDTSIHDISIKNNTQDFTGGILGFGYIGSFDNVEIENISIDTEKNENYYSRQAMIGGIAGYAGSTSAEDAGFKDCHIKNIEIVNNNADISGGIFGFDYSDTNTFKDTIIEDISISNIGKTTETYRNEYTGGISGMKIGNTENEESSFENTVFKNVFVKNTTSASIGGLYGLYNAGNKITGINVDNITIEHRADYDYKVTSNVGGLIGFVTRTNEFYIGKEKENIDDTESVIVKNINIINEYAGNNGGLVGAIFESNSTDEEDAKIIIKNAKVENVNSNVNIESISTSGNTFGGLVGMATNGIEVNDVIINNNKIDTNTSGYLGGVVGFSTSYKNAPIVKNVEMNGIILNQEVPNNLYCGETRIGGITPLIVADCYNEELNAYDTEFENINITDIYANIKTYDENGNIVYKGTSEVGGLVGLADYKDATKGFSEYTGDPVILSPAKEKLFKAKNITLSNTSDTFEDGTKKGLYGIGHTGGILGLGKFDLENIVIDNVDIESYMNVGGAVGHTESPSIIKNFNISNSNINTLDLDIGAKYHTGGVIGFVGESTLIKDTTVDNVIINNAAYGNVGGIAGSTDKTNSEEIAVTMTNVTVKNCEKELENGSKVGITGKAHVGGFIGFGKPVVVYTEPEDYSTVENCYIAGTRQPDEYDRYGYLNTDVGGFAGNMVQSGYILGAKLIDCYIENNRLREKRFPEEPYNYTELTNNVGMFTGYNDDWRDLNNIVNATSSNVTVRMNEQ